MDIYIDRTMVNLIGKCCAIEDRWRNFKFFGPPAKEFYHNGGVSNHLALIKDFSRLIEVF